MENNNKINIDDLIKESLSKEEARFYDELDDYSIFEIVGSMFKAKRRWLTILAIITTLLLIGFSFYALTQFLNTSIVEEMIKWGTGMLGGFIAIGFLKVYFWMQMDKNELLREFKRLELQVSLLSKKNKTAM